jgi:hypothetical protein
MKSEWHEEFADLRHRTPMSGITKRQLQLLHAGVRCRCGEPANRISGDDFLCRLCADIRRDQRVAQRMRRG